MARQKFKRIPFNPFLGHLDARSLPDEVTDGAVRWRQNAAVYDNRRTCRRGGHSRLFDSDPYVNQDLHDQLLSLQVYYNDLVPEPAGADLVTAYPSALCDGVLQTRTEGREPISMLYDAVSSTGRRALFAGTNSRIYLYDNFQKDWRIIADGKGPSSDRFMGASIRDTVVFTNDYAKVVSYFIGDPVSGCAMQAAKEIADLDTIGLTKAAVVVGWKGLIVLMNVEMGGVRVANRIVWSDFNNPLSWVPTASSVAGYQDLENGEIILNAMPLGDMLIVYTNRGMWQLNPTGASAQPIQFFKAYSHPTGKMCLAYRHAITSTGDVHIYMGARGINVYSSVLAVPEELAWLHQSTSILYDDFNSDLCKLPVMGYRDMNDEVWISWPQIGQTANSRCLVANVSDQHEHVDVVDHGYSAFLEHQPDDRMTIGEFVLQYGICDMSGLAALSVKAACSEHDDIVPECSPTSIYNSTEDPDGEVDANSLCACLDGLLLSEICEQCESQKIFIGASTQDLCLKEIDVGYSREVCTNPSDAGAVAEVGCYYSAVGEYEQQGYYTIYRIGPLSFDKPEEAKLLTRVFIEAYPAVSLTPAALMMAVGSSFNAYDPADVTNKTIPYNVLGNPVAAGCGVRWRRHDAKVLECQHSLSPEQMIDQNFTDEIGPYWWEVFEEGKFIYLELAIANNDAGNSACTGGECCFSRVELRTSLRPRH